MKIDVIFRTHDGGDRITTPGKTPMKRKILASKQEITRTCIYSLYKACSLCSEDVTVTVLDDNSSQYTVDLLETLFNIRVTPLEGDFQKGSLEHFTRAKNSEADLVYIVEDDFLHQEEALQEMIDTYYMFLNEVKTDAICLYPDDDYWNYEPPFGPVATKVVPGIGRPWRMNDHTTNTMFTSPQVLKDHWHPFMVLAMMGTSVKGVTEDTTINLIWKNHVPLFTPLIPLAYHLDHHPLSIPYHKIGMVSLWDSILGEFLDSEVSECMR